MLLNKTNSCIRKAGYRERNVASFQSVPEGDAYKPTEIKHFNLSGCFKVKKKRIFKYLIRELHVPSKIGQIWINVGGHAYDCHHYHKLFDFTKAELGKARKGDAFPTFFPGYSPVCGIDGLGILRT